MHYQQVFDSSLFQELEANSYLESISFFPQGSQPTWTIPSMQISFSTTAKTADALSRVLSDNMGPDDQIVFGPTQHRFAFNTGYSLDGQYGVFLNRSFRYDPQRGNLLMNVRILDGSGPFDKTLPTLNGSSSLTDGVSRVWSTNSQMLVADDVDSTGLVTMFIFSPHYFLTFPTLREAPKATFLPFLINQTYPYSDFVLLSTRYQQVYSSAFFTNLDSDLRYITSLTFLLQSSSPDNNQFGWTTTNLEIHLSTTTNNPGSLSPIFAANVGKDDVVVFNGTNQFLTENPNGQLPIYFRQPFHYDAARGNLLVDIRLNQGAGTFVTDSRHPYLEAFDSPAGLASRIWSTNMFSDTVDGMDGLGLTTIFMFSPIPVLRAEFLPFVCVGCPTNVIRISWSSFPPTFQLEEADSIRETTLWHSTTSQVFDGGGVRFIEVPLTSAAPQRYYRLIWPGGY